MTDTAAPELVTVDVDDTDDVTVDIEDAAEAPVATQPEDDPQEDPR